MNIRWIGTFFPQNSIFNLNFVQIGLIWKILDEAATEKISNWDRNLIEFIRSSEIFFNQNFAYILYLEKKSNIKKIVMFGKFFIIWYTRLNYIKIQIFWK